MKFFAIFVSCFVMINSKELICEVVIDDEVSCVISDEDLTYVTDVTFDTGNLSPGDFTHLDIVNSPMTDFPRGIFPTFSFKGLMLEENGLKEWKAEYLLGGLELSELIVTKNLIQKLNSIVFIAAPHLSCIDFSHNQISYISPNAFYGLEYLEELSLKGNKLGPELKAETFLSMPKTLEIIDLSENEIRKIEHGVFRTLRNLKEIYLYKNEFQEFDENILPAGITFLGTGEFESVEVS